jgi:hypothetical protein
MTSRVPRIKEIKLTAALYASRVGVVANVRSTGSLPANIPMGGGHIGLRLLIERRGTDIDLTPDEELVYDAIIRERRMPGGSARLVDPEFKPEEKQE